MEKQGRTSNGMSVAEGLVYFYNIRHDSKHLKVNDDEGLCVSCESLLFLLCNLKYIEV